MQCVPLVKDENYQSNYLRLVEYRGCVLNKDSVTSGTMDKIRKFKVRPTDVFVSSFPKSGTTWLQEVVFICEQITAVPPIQMRIFHSNESSQLAPILSPLLLLQHSHLNTRF